MPLLVTGIILLILGALMNANIFGTIANVFQSMALKEMKHQAVFDQANYHMYNLKLDN